eukprot:CAMPEP_0206289750 /NCGR_PEP_ID=MMETSP0106_2-20121207/2273_1 /ASSEMBLY_ACC=CAM_ASM_000206 /TAXON_ID=81532 /ORGANISM="Acanthoeca-like sp., Strain 10tr" /LENGTH=79 /DNA_ID=CAMNT_0053720305 /DNA_START=318 /DNA_END=553 /DNA_ORIENTATION=-
MRDLGTGDDGPLLPRGERRVVWICRCRKALRHCRVVLAVLPWLRVQMDPRVQVVWGAVHDGGRPRVHAVVVGAVHLTLG